MAAAIASKPLSIGLVGAGKLSASRHITSNHVTLPHFTSLPFASSRLSGVVGGGVYEILANRKADFLAIGADVKIKTICVRDVNKV